MPSTARSRNSRVSAIRLDDVSLALGGRVILDGVSLDIAACEFVGVLGPNGAGKTTLFRAVLGLVPPSRGSVEVLGAPARRGNPDIGYMPQSRAALAQQRLRGWDYVATILNGHRPGLPLPGRAGRAEIDRALDIVGARALAQRPLNELSGGERQRLLLAQALVGRPRLLLLDEPLINLDPNHQDTVVALARAIQVDLGITVLFSAHELNPLLPAIDRVLYLGHGKAALGTVDEVITGPVLSRLYGSEIDVVRLGDRIFVMSGGHDVQRDDHRHEDHPHHHPAAED
jgi:zinc/manganese transport system ATP-binding protein